jgi:hypothetical protein
VRWLVACVLCSGCELAFPLEAPEDAGGDGGGMVVPDAASAGDAPGKCPDGYATAIGLPNKYRVSMDALTWQAAEDSCELDGAAHLVVPAQVPEMANLVGLVGGARSWVGIARAPGSTTDDFRTITGSPFPSTGLMWLTGEPGGDGLAVEVANTGDARLNDVLHTFQNRFVCECDGKPVVPFSLSASAPKFPVGVGSGPLAVARP